jgi:hypothetical protein
MSRYFWMEIAATAAALAIELSDQAWRTGPIDEKDEEGGGYFRPPVDDGFDSGHYVEEIAAAAEILETEARDDRARGANGRWFRMLAHVAKLILSNVGGAEAAKQAIREVAP